MFIPVDWHSKYMVSGRSGGPVDGRTSNVFLHFCLFPIVSNTHLISSQLMGIYCHPGWARRCDRVNTLHTFRTLNSGLRRGWPANRQIPSMPLKLILEFNIDQACAANGFSVPVFSTYSVSLTLYYSSTVQEDLLRTIDGQHAPSSNAVEDIKLMCQYQ